MKKPSVAECLDEIQRLRLENDRLMRLVKSQRPELSALRAIAVQVRDLLFNFPFRLESLRDEIGALLPPNSDDLPGLMEISGLFNKGRDRIDAVIGERPSAGAVDPAVGKGLE